MLLLLCVEEERLYAPYVLWFLPLYNHESLRQQTSQGRIERPFFHLQHVLGYLPQSLGDAVAMHRLQRERLQQQQIKRARKQLCFFWRTVSHSPPRDWLPLVRPG